MGLGWIGVGMVSRRMDYYGGRAGFGSVGMRMSYHDNKISKKENSGNWMEMCDSAIENCWKQWVARRRRRVVAWPSNCSCYW